MQKLLEAERLVGRHQADAFAGVLGPGMVLDRLVEIGDIANPVRAAGVADGAAEHHGELAAGVAMVGLSPMMIAVSATNPANTVAELIAQARKNPDQFIIATAFQYSVPHLAADMLAKASGVPMRSVPFTQASQSVSAVINGDAQAVIDGVPPLDAMVRGGKLKAIGIFSDARVAGRADLPTVVETYPGMVINGWFGIVAPVGADSAAVERINRDLATVVALPEIKERFDTMGVYARNMTPAQLNTFWKQEIARWEGALKDVGAEPVQK